MVNEINLLVSNAKIPETQLFVNLLKNFIHPSFVPSEPVLSNIIYPFPFQEQATNASVRSSSKLYNHNVKKLKQIKYVFLFKRVT